MISFRGTSNGLARRQLDSWGVSTLLLSETDVVTRFFVLQHRLPEPGPYKLHLSTGGGEGFGSRPAERGVRVVMELGRAFTPPRGP